MLAVTFLHPIVLAGLVVVGVPIVLHLIMRQRPKRLPFPALRFLRLTHRTTQRRLRLRHLLLLALRILLIAAACLALAAPEVYSDRFSIAGDKPVAIAVVIDTSYSMEYTVGGHTRLDEAKRRCHEILDELPAGSRVAMLDSADPGGDGFQTVAQAKERVAGLELRPANNPVTVAVGGAYDLLAKLGEDADPTQANPPRFLYVFSDRTQACWNEHQIDNLKRMRDRVPQPGVRALFVDVGAEAPADVAITALELPRQVFPANERLVVRATVQATGTACDTELSCLIDDQGPPDRKPVKLKAGESAIVTFERPGLSPGFHHLTLNIATPDALPFDNTRYATFEVVGPRRVLTLTDDPNNVAIWRVALEPNRAFELDVRGAADVTNVAKGAPTPAELARYRAVCMLDVARPPAELWDRLARFAADGGGLAVVPGGLETDRAAYNVPAAQQLLGGTLVKPVGSEAGATWKEGGYAHPILAPFRQWRMSESVDFMKRGLEPLAYQYWLVDAPDAAAVVRYDEDNRPALLERPAAAGEQRGHVLLFTTALDDRHLRDRRTRWNNYLETSFYPVLANLAVGYLVGDTDQRNLSFTSGQTVQIPLPSDDRPAGYTLEGPSAAGGPVSVAPRQGASTADVSQALLPGNYRLVEPSGKVDGAFSMNTAAEEASLAQVATESIDALFGPNSVVGVGRGDNLHDALRTRTPQPVELFPWLMLVVLMALAAENLLSNRFYRRDNREAE